MVMSPTVARAIATKQVQDDGLEVGRAQPTKNGGTAFTVTDPDGSDLDSFFLVVNPDGSTRPTPIPDF